MTSPSRFHARCAGRFGNAVIACIAFTTASASAAPPPPASPLTPELLFGLAILGPVLVPAAAYTAGFIADLLQRSKDG